MPGAALSTAVSVGGSLIGGNANKQAANNQAAQGKAAADASNQVASTNYGQAGTNLNPYITQGANAQNSLAGLLGVGGDPQAANDAFNKYLGSTNYQFQLGQGLNAVKTANAPSFNSGATAKALNDYAQGQAGSALSGYESLLQGVGNTGAGAASNLGSLGAGEAGQVANNTFTGAGANIASGFNRANTTNQTLNGVTQGLSSFGNSSGGSSFLNGIGKSIGSIFGG